MNLHLPQTEEAKAESLTLMGVSIEGTVLCLFREQTNASGVYTDLCHFRTFC